MKLVKVLPGVGESIAFTVSLIMKGMCSSISAVVFTDSPEPWWEDEFYTAPLEPMGFQPLVSLLLLAICGLVIVSGGGVGVWFFTRGRPLAKWVLILSGVLAILFLCVIISLGFTMLLGR